METENSNRKNFETIVLKSKLTNAELVVLRERVDKLIRAGKRDIAIDFKVCEFMDSGGIGFLIHFHEQINNLKGFFACYNICFDIQYIIETSGLNNILNIFKTENDFRKSVGLSDPQ